MYRCIRSSNIGRPEMEDVVRLSALRQLSSPGLLAAGTRRKPVSARAPAVRVHAPTAARPHPLRRILSSQ